MIIGCQKLKAFWSNTKTTRDFMNIKNDYKALDQALRAIEDQIEKLQKSSQQVQTNLDQLSSKGWQDNNYKNLKESMNSHGNSLKQVLNGMEQLKIELSERSKLIKSYYSITF